MKTSRFEVLSPDEIETIHRASMEILSTVGIKVDYPVARAIFAEAGASVDEERACVRLDEALIRRAVAQAPKTFTLNGRDGSFSMTVGGEAVHFAGLGTPTRIIDLETRAYRETTMNDVVRHIRLIDGCDHIHNSQMDIWPNDIPMTGIHTESIYAWAVNSRKSYGMGCYGFLPTLDMMRMMAAAVGGKAELRARPRFLAICSVHSPLQMVQMQAEGLLICAEYGQPLAISPEGIAGATAPVTLAGLLAQENAAILAHITLAQLYRPGTPVLYGTVSTIANMRDGSVALGSVETGLITAASAQLARYYGLPTRSVGGATEAKVEDIQAGIERTATLAAAVLAGVNLITCAGTLDSTMLESDALLVLDDELAGMLLRMARGIEVNAETLALEHIRRIGFDGNYLAEEHTAQHYRHEHYLPRLMVRQPFDAWDKGGRETALERARARALRILEKHTPITLEPALDADLRAFCAACASRSLEDYYAAEDPRNQDWGNL